MLNTIHKYAYRFPADEDSDGYYLPQIVIDSVLAATKTLARFLFEQRLRVEQEHEADATPSLSQHHIVIKNPFIPLEESKRLVIDALSHFDATLGKKAEAVFHDPARWNFEHAPPGKAGGNCCAANTKDNPAPHAIIRYRYDNTINDPLYIAHELGHLIANDLATETHSEPKQHMAEVQGFTLQFILYDYLINHQPDIVLRSAASDHFNGEIIRCIYTFPIALGALHVEQLTKAHNETIPKEAIESYPHTMTEWLGEHWQSFNKAHLAYQNLNDRRARYDSIHMLHGHSMASVIAAGFFVLASQKPSEEKGKILGSVLGQESHKGLANILTHLGIASQDSVNEFIKGGLHFLKRNVREEQGPSSFVSRTERNHPSNTHAKY